MSAPPDELVKLMSGAKPGGGAPPGGPPAPSVGAPAGGPMTAPQPKEGLAQDAMIKVSMCTKLLAQALGAFGPLSEEGKAINDALRTLIKKFGAEASKADELIPAELQSLVRSLPGAGGGPPVAKAMGAIPPTQSPIQNAGAPGA